MSSKTINNKKDKKSTKALEENVSQEKLNVQIRLSDLGVIKRSPSEQELKIQGDRILYILDSIIKKVKIAVCLEMLDGHTGLIQDNLEPAEVELVYHVLTKYRKSSSKKCSIKRSNISKDIFSSLENINLAETLRTELELFNNPTMLKAFEIVWRKPELSQFLLNKFKHFNNESSINFVNAIRRLKDVVNSMLAESGIEKIARERKLRKAFKFNKKIHEEISKVENELNNQKKILGDALQTKTATVNSYQKVVSALNLSLKNEINVICMNSENEMLEDSRTSELRQVDLAEDSKNAQLQYDNLLSKNLRQEKTLRARRLKVQSQLVSWLTKFDSDIGDRQAEFDLVTKNFQEEKDELLDLRERFEEQNIEYNSLMAEKQEEDFKVWAEIAITFLKNRSARRIQRAWKAYKQRKIEKLLAKKAQAKKKAEKKAEAEAAKK